MDLSSNWVDPNQKADEKEAEASPNRAARRLAQKKELKEKKTVKNTKPVTSRAKSRAKTSKVTETRNPKTSEYEFGGVFGAISVLTFLPIFVLLLSYACDKENGYQPFLRTYKFLKNFDFNIILEEIKSWNYVSAIWYVGIIIQLSMSSTATPGDFVEGTILRDGSRLKYKLNALFTFQSFIMLTTMALRGQGRTIFFWTRKNFTDITLVSIVFSFFISLVFYIKSFFGDPLLALGGNTGNPIYDFVFGRELNPRIGSLDLKFFSSLRPGRVMWLFLNVTFAICQWSELGRVTYSMVLVNIFHAWYVLNAMADEGSILISTDITNDGFGFIHAFNNFCLVPMFYSLQTRYILDNPVDLNIFYLAVCVILQTAGYYINKSANSERNSFFSNPQDPQNARK